MAKGSSNQAIANLLKWMDRPEWHRFKINVYLAHLMPVAEQFDIPEREIPESMGSAWNLLEIFILEDFFTTWFETEEGVVNVIQEYLKRCGWKESAPGRRYLEALRDSMPSLYEVLEVNPGKSMKLKDLLGDGRTVVVQEKSATRELVTWDCLAARVVSINRQHYLTGGPLHFSRRMLSDFLDCHEDDVGRVAQSIRSREQVRHELPLLLSSFWASDVIMETECAMPEFRNSDGESILFCNVHFPVLDDMMAVAAILDEIPELMRVPEAEESEGSNDELEWSWVAPGDPGYRSLQRDKGTALPKEITEDTADDIGLTGLGFVVLNTKTLILDANSRERGERGQALLESHLGDLIGRAVTSCTDIHKMMEDRGKQDPREEIEKPPPDEDLEQSIHDYFDKHYHRVLDTPIPLLGQMTPREAANRSVESRFEVIDWLKGLENVEQRNACNVGSTAYDTTWMWRELGIRRPD